MSEKAKAVQAVAKAAEKLGPPAIEAGTKAGQYLAKLVGTVPEDVVGLALGDHVRYLRMEVWEFYARRIEEIHKKRGVKEPRPIGPKLALPAIEAATLETEEKLKELWSRLFANAMDPGTDFSLEQIFIDTVKQFEPLDVAVFARFTDRHRPKDSEIAESLGVRRTQVQVSVERLVRLGCITREGFLRPLGSELWLAVQDDAED